jgi:hypothetical protein
LVEVKMNVASGQCVARGLEQVERAVALTEKSVCGSRAAQSCEGCAAVWTTARSARVLGEEPVDAVAIADVERDRPEGRPERPARRE